MEQWNEFLEHIRNSPSSRMNLERMKHGFFKDDIDTYIALELIEEVRKNQYDEPVYELTSLGYAVLDKKISIQELKQKLQKGE